MLIWFNSDAILEWACLFGLSKIMCVDEFNQKRLEAAIRNEPYNFPQFIKDKNNYSFLSKLIGCPLCLSVWLSIFTCGVVSLLTIDFLFSLLIPVICITSLILYGIVVCLLKLQ